MEAPTGPARTGLALARALCLVWAAGLAFGVIAIMVTSRTGLYLYDAGAATLGARLEPAAVTALEVVTRLGGTMTVIFVVANCALALYRSGRCTGAAFLVCVAGGQIALSNAIKVLVRRPRPPATLLTPPESFSFPSGHATAAAATYLAVALVLGIGRRWVFKAALWGVAATITAVVAASRVLLGVHWLTDVIGGVACGPPS
jgi:undecaprenyl-diphosphatase